MKKASKTEFNVAIRRLRSKHSKIRKRISKTQVIRYAQQIEKELKSRFPKELSQLSQVIRNTADRCRKLLPNRQKGA